MVMLIREVPLDLGAGGPDCRARPAERGPGRGTSGAGPVQAGATWVVVVVWMVSQPSTSSGLRGSGPM